MDLADSREKLLRSLREQGFSTEIVDAFAAVPREKFVPEHLREEAYMDSALPLGSGATISQPSMVAVMLRELRIQPGMKVLEVGSGSGYFLALLSALGAKAVGVEIIEGLAEDSRRALRKVGIDAEVITGNAADAELESNFDRIVFSAAVGEMPKWPLADLAENGFVLAPVGYMDQELVRADSNGEERTGCLCRFVRFVE